MVQRTMTYREQSRAFMAQAYEELAKGDLAQASEKGWGAAEHMVRAVADERGWECDDYPDLHSVMDRLYRETEDSVLVDLFCSAVFLDFSYCEGAFSKEYINATLRDVEEFVKRAEGLLRKMNQVDGD